MGASTRVALTAGVVGPNTPTYLRLADRDMQFRTRSEREVALSVDKLLTRYISNGGILADAPDVFSIVVVLTAWDTLFRKLGLFGGHIYVATERGMLNLLRVTGVHNLGYSQVSKALDELQALELLYRFPVARRFHHEYDGQNQFRLSGWGRRLGHMLVEDATGELISSKLLARVERFLEREQNQYEAHSKVLLNTTPTQMDEPWQSAMRLPIPVLY